MQRSVIEFSASNVLGSSFTMFFKNFSSTLLMGAVVGLPSFLIAMHVDVFHQITRNRVDASYWLWLLIRMLTYQLMTAAIIYVTFESLRGRKVSLKRAIAHGFSNFLPAIGAAIGATLVIMVGTIAFLVPGLIAAATYAVAVPAAVMERGGLSGSALSRSAQLTSGYRKRLFGLNFIMGIVGFLGSMAVIAALADTGQTFFTASLVGLDTVLGIIYSISSTVAYHDLRVIKEGVDVDQIAAIFD